MLLSKEFFQQDTVKVARNLIGKKIVRRINNKSIAAIITETEAYRSDDPACHAYRKKTERNATLFGPVGSLYVYFTYGMHHCMNFVSRDASCIAGGVLIRGLWVVEGLEQVRSKRPGSKAHLKGPGIIAQVLDLDRSYNGLDVTNDGPISVQEGIEILPEDIQEGTRIGISVAKDYPWRFLVDNPENYCTELENHDTLKARRKNKRILP